MPGVGPRISHQHSTPVPRRAGEPSAPAHAHRAACPAVEGGARALQALLVFTRAGARCDWTTSKLGGYPSVCHPCVGNGISRGSPARGAGLKDLGSRGCMQTAGLCNQEAALGPPVAAAASCNSAPGAPEGSLGCADPRQPQAVPRTFFWAPKHPGPCSPAAAGAQSLPLPVLQHSPSAYKCGYYRAEEVQLQY